MLVCLCPYCKIESKVSLALIDTVLVIRGQLLSSPDSYQTSWTVTVRCGRAALFHLLSELKKFKLLFLSSLTP